MSINPVPKSILHDPALVMMGLVPARFASVAWSDQDRRAANSWRMAWVTIAVGLAAIIAIFWSTAAQIVDIWYHSASFNHGFLILPICGYLIWLKRGVLANYVPRPSVWGLVFILLAGFGWLMGRLGSVAMVEHFALVFILQGMFLTVFGTQIARRLVFPLCYMIFAVPFGQFMIEPMQDLTAVFVVKGLQIINIPVFLDGIFISIPTGNFVVAETCSGVRFLIATIALGVLFAHLTYRSYWRKTAFVALSFVVPVVANGFRAFGIVLTAYLSDNTIAVGVDHIVYGWIFFSIVTAVLLLLGMTFRDDEDDEVVSAPGTLRGSPAALGHHWQIGLSALVGMFVSALAPVYAYQIETRPAPQISRDIQMPGEIGDWKQTVSQMETWSPVYPAAGLRMQRQYVRGGDRVDLFIAYYARQEQGAELIHMGNSVANLDQWSRAQSELVTVDFAGRPQTMERTRLLGRRGLNRVVYKWYCIGGRFTSNPYVAKLLQAASQLFAWQEAAASVIVSAPYDDVPAEADRVLRAFLASAHSIAPLLQKTLKNR